MTGRDHHHDHDDDAIADNEQVCDARLQPLTMQIHDICEAHGIPVIIAFEYKPEHLCTTCYVPSGACEQLKLGAAIIRGQAAVTQVLLGLIASADGDDEESA